MKFELFINLKTAKQIGLAKFSHLFEPWGFP